MNEKILFVDDEISILQAYGRVLRKSFTVVPASSGAEALQLIESEGPFPVVVSDMQMPEMNGVEFLSRMKEKYPDTVRLMLTGNADQATAISAINEGDVYRFLNKPCPPEEMISAINSALNHHRLINAEQELLENTVRGSIQALVEILSIVSPKIFGHASAIKDYALKCSAQLGLPSSWELEAASLLGQIGVVTLPEQLMDDVEGGRPLVGEGLDAYQKHPEVGANLIDKIPRMQGISESIRYQAKGFDGSGAPKDGLKGKEIPIGGRILRVVSDLVAKEATGLSSSEAVARLKANGRCYDPEVLSAIEQVVSSKSQRSVEKISVTQLAPGMIIAEDLVAISGTLLVRKEQAVSASMCERLLNYCLNNLVADEIYVYQLG